MRFTVIIRNLLFLAIFLSATVARAEGYTILVMGDSIGAAYGLNEEDGWASLTEKALQEEGFEVNVVNASISGDTTAGGLRRLPDALDRFTPDLLVIELGGNDGLRGYPPKTVQKNLEGMASIAHERDIDVLILGMLIPSNYGPAYLNLFKKAFSLAAKSTDSALLPFLLEPIAQDRAYFQADGIHPTADAQPLLMQHVLPSIMAFVTGDS